MRWMILRDRPEVLEIEAACFETPWSEEDFVRCLKQRNCIGLVAEHDDQAVGFMIYELHKTRLHLLNFAVSTRYRRQGVGTQMAAKLVTKLSALRRVRATLHIRDSNLAGQLFWSAQGFRAVSVLRSFYDDADDDAYLMQYRFQPERAAVASGGACEGHRP